MKKSILVSMEKALKYKDKLDAECDKVFNEVKKVLDYSNEELLDFGAHIFYQPSDGLVLCIDMLNVQVHKVFIESKLLRRKLKISDLRGV